MRLSRLIHGGAAPKAPPWLGPTQKGRTPSGVGPTSTRIQNANAEEGRLGDGDVGKFLRREPKPFSSDLPPHPVAEQHGDVGCKNEASRSAIDINR